ncbi:MAG: YitT family protein [Erysipelotrichaceae bacterium]|nr:YitT family protein [Erysipelotrichaceae bacterium]
MLKKIKNILCIILGCFVLAVGVESFILPYNILSGGVAGIAVLLKPFIPISEETVVVVLNILLFALGTAFLGREFAINTVVATAAYPICLVVAEKIIPSFEVEPLIAAIYGGLLGGIGTAICIHNGGSTGGMDIPPLIIEKYFNFDVSKEIMVCDALTVSCGLWIYGIEPVLIGLICVFLYSFGVEKFMSLYDGRLASKRIEIISDHYDEIISDIHITVDRGTTLLDASGGYTYKPKKVILCVVPEKDYQKVIDIVNKYDKSAFIIVSQTYDVHGEGFTFEGRL